MIPHIIIDRWPLQSIPLTAIREGETTREALQRASLLQGSPIVFSAWGDSAVLANGQLLREEACDATE